MRGMNNKNRGHMVKVNFFGALKMDLGLDFVELSAKSIKEVYTKLIDMFDVMKKADIGQYITFVNGENIANLNKEDTVLKDGDEIKLLSPIFAV